jgi:hypothetical protein
MARALATWAGSISARVIPGAVPLCTNKIRIWLNPYSPNTLLSFENSVANFFFVSALARIIHGGPGNGLASVA